MNKLTILSIETSCDETAVAVVDGVENENSVLFSIRGNALISQVNLHRPYGGVFPTIAKREHAKNLTPLTVSALKEAGLLHEKKIPIQQDAKNKILKIFEREVEMAEQFFSIFSKIEIPQIDSIAVTSGPGLPPALWIGVNFAQALSIIWNKPIVPINHMEGHILAALAIENGPTKNTQNNLSNLIIPKTDMPVLALLISGGHTELVLMKEWLSYELIGQTRDDAVGEAFDKVARLLGLPYPGGPEISNLSEQARISKSENKYKLPRPMISDNTCDFSFAGLKTATRYLIRDIGNIDEDTQKNIALEFENAVTDVLVKKTLRALDETNAKTLVLGGGVCANTHIRKTFTETITNKYSNISLRIPNKSLTTDNAIMIALSGFYRTKMKEFVQQENLVADGNAKLVK